MGVRIDGGHVWKLVWKLQGSYGRTAAVLIEDGVCQAASEYMPMTWFFLFLLTLLALSPSLSLSLSLSLI